MPLDYSYFSQSRELFPRREQFNTNQLICVHLNKLKFTPNVDTYLLNRSNNVRRGKAVAKSRQCICHRQQIKSGSSKAKLTQIIDNFANIKKTVHLLENMEINIPKSYYDF